MARTIEDFETALLVERVATRFARAAAEEDYKGRLFVTYAEDGRKRREGPLEQSAAKRRLNELIRKPDVTNLGLERED